jgi:hypothetical protein
MVVEDSHCEDEVWERSLRQPDRVEGHDLVAVSLHAVDARVVRARVLVGVLVVLVKDKAEIAGAGAWAIEAHVALSVAAHQKNRRGREGHVANAKASWLSRAFTRPMATSPRERALA